VIAAVRVVARSQRTCVEVVFCLFCDVLEDFVMDFEEFFARCFRDIDWHTYPSFGESLDFPAGVYVALQSYALAEEPEDEV
jgi:hypothetical protein